MMKVGLVLVGTAFFFFSSSPLLGGHGAAAVNPQELADLWNLPRDSPFSPFLQEDACVRCGAQLEMSRVRLGLRRTMLRRKGLLPRPDPATVEWTREVLALAIRPALSQPGGDALTELHEAPSYQELDVFCSELLTALCSECVSTVPGAGAWGLCPAVLRAAQGYSEERSSSS